MGGKNLISNNMRLIQFLTIFKIFGEYTVIAQTESPNPEEGLFDIDRAKKVSATEKLDSLIFDIKNWVDDHFTSGVALKKKEKYEHKVQKLTSRFQNFFEKCGLENSKKNKNGKERKRRRVTRDTTESLEQLGLIFKGFNEFRENYLSSCENLEKLANISFKVEMKLINGFGKTGLEMFDYGDYSYDLSY